MEHILAMACEEEPSAWSRVRLVTRNWLEMTPFVGEKTFALNSLHGDTPFTGIRAFSINTIQSLFRTLDGSNPFLQSLMTVLHIVCYEASYWSDLTTLLDHVSDTLLDLYLEPSFRDLQIKAPHLRSLTLFNKHGGSLNPGTIHDCPSLQMLNLYVRDADLSLEHEWKSPLVQVKSAVLVCEWSNGLVFAEAAAVLSLLIKRLAFTMPNLHLSLLSPKSFTALDYLPSRLDLAGLVALCGAHSYGGHLQLNLYGLWPYFTPGDLRLAKTCVMVNELTVSDLWIDLCLPNSFPPSLRKLHLPMFHIFDYASSPWSAVASVITDHLGHLEELSILLDEPALQKWPSEGAAKDASTEGTEVAIQLQQSRGIRARLEVSGLSQNRMKPEFRKDSRNGQNTVSPHLPERRFSHSSQTADLALFHTLLVQLKHKRTGSSLQNLRKWASRVSLKKVAGEADNTGDLPEQLPPQQSVRSTCVEV